MAEYSLTLSSLKFANVSNFIRTFGTKKTALQNAGSLTTEECNVANALPFDIMRPLVITETSTVSNIQYDAKILINAARVTLTLASTGVTEGITVTLMAAYAASIVFNTTSQDTTITDTLQAGEQAKLIFIGGRWEVLQDCGDVTSRAGTLKPFGTIICDGSTALLQARYPRLFAELGVRYNLTTDSNDVFRVPDYTHKHLETDNYSTTEQFTGKYWTDGKPIYSKIVAQNFLLQNIGWENIADVSNLNIDTCVKTMFSFNWSIEPTRYTNGASNVDIAFNSLTKYIQSFRNNTTGNYTIQFLCIEYTKTTDTDPADYPVPAPLNWIIKY